MEWDRSADESGVATLRHDGGAAARGTRASTAATSSTVPGRTTAGVVPVKRPVQSRTWPATRSGSVSTCAAPTASTSASASEVGAATLGAYGVPRSGRVDFPGDTARPVAGGDAAARRPELRPQRRARARTRRGGCARHHPQPADRGHAHGGAPRVACARVGPRCGVQRRPGRARGGDRARARRCRKRRGLGAGTRRRGERRRRAGTGRARLPHRRAPRVRRAMRGGGRGSSKESSRSRPGSSCRRSRRTRSPTDPRTCGATCSGASAGGWRCSRTSPPTRCRTEHRSPAARVVAGPRFGYG